MTTPLGGMEKTKSRARSRVGVGGKGGRESALVTLTGSLSPRPGGGEDGGGGEGDFSALKIFRVFTLRDKVMMMKEYGVGTDKGDRERRDLKNQERQMLNWRIGEEKRL